MRWSRLGIAMMLARHGGGMAAGALRGLLDVGFQIAALFLLPSTLLRLWRRAGGAGRRASRRLAGAARLGGFARAACSICSARCRGSSTSRSTRNTRASSALSGSSSTIRYSPGLAILQRVIANARHALLSVLLGFGDRAARRGEPRLSVRAQHRSPTRSARSRRRCGGRS